MNNRNHSSARFVCGAALAAMAFCGTTGCVAFKIGDPEIVSAEFQPEKREQRTLSREVLAAGPLVTQKRDFVYVARADDARALGLGAAMNIPAGKTEIIVPGNVVKKYGIANALNFSDAFTRRPCQVLHVGLGGTVRTRERGIDAYRKFEITRQRRLSFGLFPGFAEKIYRPDGSLYPLIGKYDEDGDQNWEHFEDGYSFAPIRGLFITPWSLVITPLFGKFECHSHYWKGENIDMLDLLSQEERERIGINTRPLTQQIATRGSIAHSSWLGFHRYENLSIGEQGFSHLDAKEVTTNRMVYVTGPYLVEVQIPSLGYSQTQEILSDESNEAFILPSVLHDTEVDVKVRFLKSPYVSKTIPDGNEQAILDEVIGKTFGAKVLIRGIGVMKNTPTAPQAR